MMTIAQLKAVKKKMIKKKKKTNRKNRKKRRMKKNPQKRKKNQLQKRRKLLEKKKKESDDEEGEEEEEDSETVTLNKKKVPELKEMLKHNEQVCTGNKADLIDRIIECRKNGCFPRCPKCGIGRMKQEGKKLKCPGGHDDEHFVRCGHTVKPSEIERPAWQELPEKDSK